MAFFTDEQRMIQIMKIKLLDINWTIIEEIKVILRD